VCEAIQIAETLISAEYNNWDPVLMWQT